MMLPVYTIAKTEGAELRPSGNAFRGLCLVHDRDGRNPSCIYGENHWHCFSCGESGDGPALIMKTKGMTFPQALAYLGEDRQRPTWQKKAKRTRERKKREAAEWRERDLAWTLGALIRIGHKAFTALTPENLEPFGQAVDNVATWERWLVVLIHGDKEDKAAMVAALEDFPVYPRGRLFREDFNYRAWLSQIDQPEGKPEPHNDIKTCSIEIPLN